MMKTTLLFFMTLTLSLLAKASTLEIYHCRYSVYSAPFAEVRLNVRDGQPDDRAQIIFQGRQGEESVTVEPTAEGEKFHLWLSKESSTNNLELIIYERAQPDGDSLMINPHMPVLNRMWGQCEVSQSKTLVEQ